MPGGLCFLLQAVVMLVAVALICYYNFMAVRCSRLFGARGRAVEGMGRGSWARGGAVGEAGARGAAEAGGCGSLPPCPLVATRASFFTP